MTHNDILRGLKEGCVKIIDSPDGGVACRIGEYWFYFCGIEAETMPAKEYLEVTPIEKTAKDIFETLQDFKLHPEVFGFEYDYYEAIFNEHNYEPKVGVD